MMSIISRFRWLIHLTISLNYVFSGVDSVGTVSAALVTYAAIQALQPDLIINAGTSGGFKVCSCLFGLMKCCFNYFQKLQVLSRFHFLLTFHCLKYFINPIQQRFILVYCSKFSNSEVSYQFSVFDLLLVLIFSSIQESASSSK